MKSYLILIPIFLFALLQGTFLPLNLVLLTVIFYANFREEKEGFLVAFIAGLFLDLAKGETLGVSSFLLLVIIFLLYLYSRRFNSHQPLFLAFFSGLSVAFFGKILYGFFDWKGGLFLAFLSFAIGNFLKLFWFDGRKIRT